MRRSICKRRTRNCARRPPVAEMDTRRLDQCLPRPSLRLECNSFDKTGFAVANDFGPVATDWVEVVLARILVTGAAGMIGFHTVQRLAQSGHEVFGCDGFTPYYDIGLKQARAGLLFESAGLRVETIDLCDAAAFDRFYAAAAPDCVVHLAAQPGVRQGLDHPRPYIASNLVAFANLLDSCRKRPPRHLLYASSSSVYGANTVLPWSEDQSTDLAISLYAATKKANEVMAHSYSHITGIPMTGLRFFTVYGEWGRPDMAPYKFMYNILNGKEITVYGRNRMSRDFTYVKDAVESVFRLLTVVPDRKSAGFEGISPVAPHRIVNIGSGRPIALADFIEMVEAIAGRAARIRYADHAPGDVADTFADSSRLERLTAYRPVTRLEDGLKFLRNWFEDHAAAAVPP